jgi:hypothetical protein
MDGFDASDHPIKWINGAGSSASTVTRYGVGRTAQIFSDGYISRAFTPSSQVFIGFSITTNKLDDGAVHSYVSVSGDSGATRHISVGYSLSAISVWRGAPGGVLLASYPYPFIANTWYPIEVSATIAATDGTCVVKLNGATVIDFTGNTKNGGTSTDIDYITLGCIRGGYIGNFDDLYVCNSTGPAPYNTFLGEVRIYPLVPSAAGSSTQFTPSTGANYAAVDELPYSPADYVSGGTSGLRDLYTMSDLQASAGTVLAVQSNVIARKSDAAAVSLKPAIKSGATIYYGSSTSLGPSVAVLVDTYVNDPATSAPWTADGVNALEAGFEVV